MEAREASSHDDAGASRAAELPETPSPARATRWAQDIRTKTLVLVLFSALIPLTAGFFTARTIILEKVYTRLLGQAEPHG